MFSVTIIFYSESDNKALNPPFEINKFSLSSLCLFPGSYSSCESSSLSSSSSCCLKSASNTRSFSYFVVVKNPGGLNDNKILPSAVKRKI